MGKIHAQPSTLHTREKRDRVERGLEEHGLVQGILLLRPTLQ